MFTTCLLSSVELWQCTRRPQFLDSKACSLMGLSDGGFSCAVQALFILQLSLLLGSQNRSWLREDERRPNTTSAWCLSGSVHTMPSEARGRATPERCPFAVIHVSLLHERNDLGLNICWNTLYSFKLPTPTPVPTLCPLGLRWAQPQTFPWLKLKHSLI